MRKNREIVTKWIGLSEGGFVNNKKDPGGATDRGITQQTFDGWNRSKNQPLKSVRGISKELADSIIFENYMVPIKFDELPSGLDYAVADYSVNSGPSRAVKELQRILGLKQDGFFGVQTMSKVKAVAAENGIADLIQQYCQARIAFMKVIRHPTTKARLWDEFGTGWQRRVMGKHDGAQPDQDNGVIDRAILLWQNQEFAETISAPKYQESAKAPEPEAPHTTTEDPASVGGLIGGGGAVTALGAVLSSIGNLHPIVQGIAVLALVVAVGGAAWVLYDRHKRHKTGLV